MSRRDRLFKKAKRSGFPRLQEAYKSQRNATMSAIKCAYNKYVSNIMDDLDTEDSSSQEIGINIFFFFFFFFGGGGYI